MKKRRHIGKTEFNFYTMFAKCLPKRLIYFCFLHVMVYGTTGKYGNTTTPELTGMEAMKRYGDDNYI